MGRYRITCINKDDRKNPYERIQNVGIDDGKVYPQQTIVNTINQKLHTFYVKIGGKEVEVTTSTSRFGHQYIKTVSDGDEPNNLLSLMECIS